MLFKRISELLLKATPLTRQSIDPTQGGKPPEKLRKIIHQIEFDYIKYN